MKKKIFFILFQQPKNKLKPKMFLKILIKILLKKNHYFLEEIKEKIYLVYTVALGPIHMWQHTGIIYPSRLNNIIINVEAIIAIR